MSDWGVPVRVDRDEREAVRQLLGRNPDRYLRTYDRMRPSGRRLVLGWCWSGFAFGSVFAFYRRLYRPILVLEGALALLGAATLALIVSLGFALGNAAIAASLAAWLTGASLYALLGRSWVIRACLERLDRASAVEGAPLAAWAGPLCRVRTLLFVLLAAVLPMVALDLFYLHGDASQEPAAAEPASPSWPAAPFTGAIFLDVPVAMLVGSAPCLIVGWLVWRWARRKDVLWPCSGAVAVGIVAAYLAGQLGESLPRFVHLFAAGERLFAANYLWVAPVEEGCKLLLLACIFMGAEPIADRRGAVAAAFLVAVGFEVVETFMYLGDPYSGMVEIAGRALPRHLLFAVFTAVGLAAYVARGRWWTLLVAWLAATLAHAAYNVAGVILTVNLLPVSPLERWFLEQVFGVDPNSLVGKPWLAIAYAHLAGLAVALAGAALLLRYALAAPSRDAAPAAAADAAPV